MVGQLPPCFSWAVLHCPLVTNRRQFTQNSTRRRKRKCLTLKRDFEWIEQPRRKCKKICIRTKTGSYFLIFLDPQLFHLPETQDGAGLLLLEFSMLTHYFMFRQFFQNTFVPTSCSTSHPSVPEVKLVFFFKWVISFSLLRIWPFLALSVSNLDKIASFIVSDFKHVQECKYVCSWQLGLVFLPGKVWKGDFLDRITLAVSSLNVCLQEQKVAEWRAVTCLVNNPSFTEQYTTDWITRSHKENKQREAKSNQLCGRKCFI